MAKRPTFETLKKSKPVPEPTPVDASPPPNETRQVARMERIQTSVRLEPGMWAALNDLATRKRVEGGQRVTVHDLLIEGGRHILAVNGVKLS